MFRIPNKASHREKPYFFFFKHLWFFLLKLWFFKFYLGFLTQFNSNNYTMKTKFYGILTLLLAFVVQFSFAQKTITGTVSDASGTLPGVSVLIKGTTTGTETDFDGKYSIKADAGAVLVFSYLGYKQVEKTVGSASVINVTLEEDNNVLDEIVVVGYGTTTRKAYAGTAKTVSAENIQAKNFSNVSQALAGEVAGVTVINSSGQPGSIGTIRIRGYGSPNGNRAPLYVIDGIPWAGTFDLNSINPNDIKSTTVLKDATATAIYGSRGANGVIVITTKSGSSSGKSSIEVDVKTGVNSQLIPRYDVISNPEQYIGLVWEGLYNRGQFSPSSIPGSLNGDPVAFANLALFGGSTGVPGESLPVGAGRGYNMWNATGGNLIDPATRMVRQGVQRLFTPERYADEAFGTPGSRTEANVRFQGGNGTSNYFVSVGYLDDVGYTINSDFRRYTTRINVNSQVRDWLKVGINLGYSYSESTNNGQTNGSENVFEFADKMAPIYPVFARYPSDYAVASLQGQLIPDPVFGGSQYDFGAPTGGTVPGGNPAFTRDRPNANLLNPIATAILDFNGSEIHSLNGNFTAKFDIMEGLTYETRFGGQYSMQKFISSNNHVYGTSAGSNGNLSITDTERWSMNTQQLLRYNKSFGDHSLDVLAAYETNERSFASENVYKENVIQPGVFFLNNYKVFPSEPSGSMNRSGIESVFGQVNYNYKGKYFFSGSLRTDGSSRFVNDKWGTFGSVGASWVMSEEDFMADTPFDYLKLKASWGVTGDQDGVSTASGFTTFNRLFVGGALSLPESNVGNPDLTWETSRMWQVGAEMSVGKYLDANFDYYYKTTDNLFFPARRGPSVGFASILVNDGEVLNSGFEFDLTGHLIDTEDFKLDLNINGEILNNEMLVMPIDASSGTNKVIDIQGTRGWAVGRSIFDFFMREWAGVDPTNGAPLWFQYWDDQNNNGMLDAGEPTSAASGAQWFVPDPNNAANTNGLNTTGTLFEYRQLVPGANIQRMTTSTYGSATEVYLDKSLIPDLRGAFRLSGQVGNFDFSTQFLYSLGGWAYDGQYGELMNDRFGAAGNNFHSDILNRWQQPGDITNIPRLGDGIDQLAGSTSSRFVVSTDYLALNNARVGYTVPKSFLGESGIDALNLWVSGDNLFIESARNGFFPNITESGNSGRRQYAPPTTITLGVRVKF